MAVVAGLALAACSDLSGPGGSGTWFAIAMGTGHACALTPKGAAYCWGSDVVGQLGNGSANDGGSSPKPVAVARGIPFAGISAGNGITCGVSIFGPAFCWGANDVGSIGLGDSTVVQVDTPATVAGNISFGSISTEFFHTCALTTTGSGYCWGQNASGALGVTNPSGNAYDPVAVSGTHTFKTITAGYQQQSCALDASFKAYCWGVGGVSGTGDTAAAIYAPEAVQGGLQFVVLHANGSRVCGVVIGGAGYCWGDGRQGELGNDTMEIAAAPSAIAGGLAFTDVEPAQLGHFTCGLTNSGAVYCWGHDANVLGDTTMHTAPIAVGGSLRFQHLSVGGEDVCGITESGDAYCWGRNASGELADGTATPSSTPRKIPAP